MESAVIEKTVRYRAASKLCQRSTDRPYGAMIIHQMRANFCLAPGGQIGKEVILLEIENAE